MCPVAVEKNPAAERYLTVLKQALSVMQPVDRSEVLGEIRSHIHDATAAGRPLDEILARLGPADALAKAYLVESYLNPKLPGANWMIRTLGLFGILVFGSLPTLLLTCVLGPLGLAFSIAGPVIFTSGICGFFGVSLEPVVQSDLAPWESIILGPIMGVFAAICVWALFRYLQWVTRLIRQVAAGR